MPILLLIILLYLKYLREREKWVHREVLRPCGHFSLMISHDTDNYYWLAYCVLLEIKGQFRNMFIWMINRPMNNFDRFYTKCGTISNSSDEYVLNTLFGTLKDIVK